MKEKTVLITGCTSGIGYETAKMLKSKGAEVVICGRNKAKVDQASNELNVKGFVADVSNENKVKAVLNVDENSIGRIKVGQMVFVQLNTNKHITYDLLLEGMIIIIFRHYAICHYDITMHWEHMPDQAWPQTGMRSVVLPL